MATDLSSAMAEVSKLRTRVKASHPGFIRTEEASHMLDLVGEALAEAQRELTAHSEVIEQSEKQLAAYRGELAARDGCETILTLDRIGPNGVPVNHAVGTILAATDSDRRWRLSSELVWEELP